VHGVVTHLENLKKSGNLKVVRENGKSQGKVGEFHVVWRVATLCAVTMVILCSLLDINSGVFEDVEHWAMSLSSLL